MAANLANQKLLVFKQLLLDDIFVLFFGRHVVNTVALFAVFVIVEVAVGFINLFRLDLFAVLKTSHNFKVSDSVLL